MLTLIFYDAHSNNHITITVCFLCSQENLHDMPTIIFYDANHDNHVTLKICLLRFQDNLHDTLCISPSVKICPTVRLLVRWIRSIHRTFGMLANNNNNNNLYLYSPIYNYRSIALKIYPTYNSINYKSKIAVYYYVKNC